MEEAIYLLLLAFAFGKIAGFFSDLGVYEQGQARGLLYSNGPSGYIKIIVALAQLFAVIAFGCSLYWAWQSI